MGWLKIRDRGRVRLEGGTLVDLMCGAPGLRERLRSGLVTGGASPSVLEGEGGVDFGIVVWPELKSTVC